MSKNQLRHATSPYLLQHADNPVEWHEWSPETLVKAQLMGRPILLSVGYAACHWCHVMAHESFEDAETAKIMNELFINIKVDREERPDIDHIYMSALHAMGQQGGWPLTMFLTPKGEPFWGGTYFPKLAQYGRPAFTDLLHQIAKTYREKPEAILRNAEALTPQAPTALLSTDIMSPPLVAAASERFEAAFDPKYGGMRGAPKFPNAPILDYMFRAALQSPHESKAGLVLHTLQNICAGGIYDHLGGGIARYSTDEFWLVPHFEKMLYDNAQLLELLCIAWQYTRDPIFKSRAEQTVAWLERELTNPQGAFCASLDADSDGVEGRYYIWTYSEILAVLGDADTASFAVAYNVSKQGNWHDEATNEPVNILNRSAQMGVLEEPRIVAMARKLRHHRDTRTPPGLDDKILADWNGLTISALCHAAIAFNQPKWLTLADTALRFVTESMTYSSEKGGKRLGHSYRNKQLQSPGLASDYAFIICAALAMHEATFTTPTNDAPDWLQLAIDLAEAVNRHHIDPPSGLLCMSADDATDVIVRLAPTVDDAIPNAHGHYLQALHQLAAHTGQDKWRQRANLLWGAVSHPMSHQPLGHCGLMSARMFHEYAAQITLIGTARQALYQAALALPFHNRIIIDGNRLHQDLDTKPGNAIICIGQTCSLPLTTVDEMETELAKMTVTKNP